MKTLRSKSALTSGNSLLATVIVTAVIGTALAAYLSLVRVQNGSTHRSQAWNATVPVIEAGIEDALAHLNAHGETNLACDGWTQSGNIWWMKRAVGDAYYVATISNWIAGATNNSPSVEARGYVTLPIVVSIPHAGPFVANFTASAHPYMGRGVRVKTKQEFIFVKGLVAEDTIDMNGNNIETDSFDPLDPAASTNGLYDVTKRKYNGDIATNSSLTNSINVGNANIRGRLSTGPKGSTDIGPQGKVGDSSWFNDTNRKGIQSGALRDDMNVDFREVSSPTSTGGFTPSDGDVNGEYYEYVLSGNNTTYQMTSLRLAGPERMLVTGNVILYVTTELDISGQASIQIAPGASLKLYVSAPTASIDGNGIVNNTGSATNFIYYGLPTNTQLTIGGNGSFVGAIYAPQTVLRLNGGGSSTTYDFTGAAVVKKAILGGHINFHYDESLRIKGPPKGFVVTSWNEMTPSEVAATALDCSPNGVSN